MKQTEFAHLRNRRSLLIAVKNKEDDSFIKYRKSLIERQEETTEKKRIIMFYLLKKLEIDPQTYQKSRSLYM